MFWVFTAIFADHDHHAWTRWRSIGRVKNPLPGTPLVGAEDRRYTHGSCWAATTWRATCSRRMVMGARQVLTIAPAATAFAFMVGITLGLPAGYFGGKLDTVAVVPRQPRAGLPGDPAVLPAGHAGNPRHRHPDRIWRPCCSSSRSSSSAILFNSRFFTNPPQAQPLCRHHAGDRALGLFRPCLQRGPAWASGRWSRTC